MLSACARIVRIGVSPGGGPQRPLPTARVTALGLQDDAHRDLGHHGEPERALCLFSLDRIRALQDEGHPITPGSIGKNVTLEGVPRDAAAPGLCLLLGLEVIAQVTRCTMPCGTITASRHDRDYSRVSPPRHPGDHRVYVRMLREGSLANGDPVQLLTEVEARRLIDSR